MQIWLIIVGLIVTAGLITGGYLLMKSGKTPAPSPNPDDPPPSPPHVDPPKPKPDDPPPPPPHVDPPKPKPDDPPPPPPPHVDPPKPKPDDPPPPPPPPHVDPPHVDPPKPKPDDPPPPKPSPPSPDVVLPHYLGVTVQGKPTGASGMKRGALNVRGAAGMTYHQLFGNQTMQVVDFSSNYAFNPAFPDSKIPITKGSTYFLSVKVVNGSPNLHTSDDKKVLLFIGGVAEERGDLTDTADRNLVESPLSKYTDRQSIMWSYQGYVRAIKDGLSVAIVGNYDNKDSDYATTIASVMLVAGTK